MWMRDRREEQFSSDTWLGLEEMLNQTPFPDIPEISYPFHDADAWMTVVKSLPSGKAGGPCGWSNDELKLLPTICMLTLQRSFSLSRKLALANRS